MGELFCQECQLLSRRVHEVQLLLRECPLLRDVLGGVFLTWATVEFFIDTSDSSVNVRAMVKRRAQFSVFGFQWEGEPNRRWQWVRSPARRCARTGIAALVQRRKETGKGLSTLYCATALLSLPQGVPTYPHRTFPDIFGHFLPGTGDAARERGSLRWWRRERRLDGRGMRVRERIFPAAGSTNSALFGMNSALFCSFLYEFCFILYVFCFVFGEKPRYWAENGVVRA